MTEHEFDVVEEAIDPVVPRDDEQLHQANDKSRKRGGVAVDQLQDVHTGASAHEQAQQEHQSAGRQQDPPTSGIKRPTNAIGQKESSIENGGGG